MRESAAAGAVSPSNLFPNDRRIRMVADFEALVSTPFADGVNALCWPRELAGDFGEVVQLLECGPGITSLDEKTLLKLPVSSAGAIAVDAMINDLNFLQNKGLDPSLDAIRGYQRDDIDPGPVPTDVYSYHVDSATVAADTYLCTYYGPSSEGLRNEDACRRVDIPEIRSELLKRYAEVKEEGEDFEEYLNAYHYDLHYQPKGPEALPYVFGRGNLWRIAVQYPGSQVPPCIHRAPETQPGDEARLLLIS